MPKKTEKRKMAKKRVRDEEEDVDSDIDDDGGGGKEKGKTKRGKNPYILDEVEEADDDYESGDDYDDESVASSERVKKAKKRHKPERESKELAAARAEAERRMKQRSEQPQRNLFGNMTDEQLQAFARAHYGDDTFGEGEGEEEYKEGLSDYTDDEDEEDIDMGIYMDSLNARGLSLWMVRCKRRAERVNVRKVKRRVRQLKKAGEEALPIDKVFCHAGIVGLFWVESKSRKDLLDSLADCKVPCKETNVKLVPIEELSATYKPRPRPPKEDEEKSVFKVGSNVRVTGRGVFFGREGMVLEANDDEDSVMVIFLPGATETYSMRRDELEIQ